MHVQLYPHLARSRCILGRGHHLLQQRRELHGLHVLQRTACLQRGELHHPVDHFLDALRLARDVGQKLLPLLGRHARLLQQFCRAADGRQRALDLVRERLHVVGDVVAPGKRVAHLVVGGANDPQRAPAQARQAEAPLRAHVAHVVGNQPEGPHQPDRHDHGQQHHRHGGDDAHIQRLAPRRLDELAEALHGLAHGDCTHDVVVPAHGGAHVHDGCIGVLLNIC